MAADHGVVVLLAEGQLALKYTKPFREGVAVRWRSAAGCGMDLDDVK